MTKLSLLATLAILMPLAATAKGTPGSHFIENWDLDENRSLDPAKYLLWSCNLLLART